MEKLQRTDMVQPPPPTDAAPHRYVQDVAPPSDPRPRPLHPGHRWELESAGPGVSIPLPLLLLLLLLPPDLPARVVEALQIDKHALAITPPRPLAPHATHLSPHATMSVRGQKTPTFSKITNTIRPSESRVP
ncbi:hypothetical protein O3P69_009759 [Scylla paramamosain]|uniref:Uncharacterized protein n=1 Tax=Scylla paramamosain TaxID=85552 RepID=A0AAW0SN58_SCYPA